MIPINIKSRLVVEVEQRIRDLRDEAQRAKDAGNLWAEGIHMDAAADLRRALAWLRAQEPDFSPQPITELAIIPA